MHFIRWNKYINTSVTVLTLRLVRDFSEILILLVPNSNQCMAWYVPMAFDENQFFGSWLKWKVEKLSVFIREFALRAISFHTCAKCKIIIIAQRKSCWGINLNFLPSIYLWIASIIVIRLCSFVFSHSIALHLCNLCSMLRVTAIPKALKCISFHPWHTKDRKWILFVHWKCCIKRNACCHHINDL